MHTKAIDIDGEGLLEGEKSASRDCRGEDVDSEAI